MCGVGYYGGQIDICKISSPKEGWAQCEGVLIYGGLIRVLFVFLYMYILRLCCLFFLSIIIVVVHFYNLLFMHLFSEGISPSIWLVLLSTFKCFSKFLMLCLGINPIHGSKRMVDGKKQDS